MPSLNPQRRTRAASLSVIGNGALKMVESDSAPNSQKGDQVLRSIQQWMVQQAHAAKTTNQAADVDNHASGKGCHPSPSMAPREPSIEASGSASPESIDPSQQ